MSWIKRFQRRLQLGKASSPRQIFIANDVARFIERLTTSSTSTLAVWSNSHFLQMLSTKIQSNCVEKNDSEWTRRIPRLSSFIPFRFHHSILPKTLRHFFFALAFPSAFFREVFGHSSCNKSVLLGSRTRLPNPRPRTHRI